MTWAASPANPPAAPPKPRIASPVTLPVLGENGKPRREFEAEGYRVSLDLSPQVLWLEAPEERGWQHGDFSPGDTVEVASSGVQLQQDKSYLAKLSKGQMLPVVKVEGKWLATSIVVDGVRKDGWVPKESVKAVPAETSLRPTLVGLTQPGFVSAAVLAQKAKQFDDGLYAAIDLAAQRGAGKFGGKAPLLEKLSERLANEKTPDAAALVVLAATRLGGGKTSLSSAQEKLLSAAVAKFRADELRSKPISFYTWSQELAAIFQQDRMLQQELRGKASIESVVKAIHADPASRGAYEAYLQLVAKLTNPLVGELPDLRGQLAALDSGKLSAPTAGMHFFPPSQSHEGELVKKLYGNRPIPAGFNLADELIARIRSGKIDLAPRPESGWYDYQTWSLETLVKPESAAEASKVQFGENYRKQLTELFKGLLALARETHAKQLEIPAPAAAAFDDTPKPVIIYVQPDLAVEPLATHYERRAAGYRFLRGALVEAFGAEALAKLHRQTANGPVAVPLDEELNQVEALFHGACVAANLQLGLAPDSAAPAGTPEKDLAAAKSFLDWGANAELDPDLFQDARMMVPVFYDQQRKLTKVWCFLGWSTQNVTVSFAKEPPAVVTDKEGRPADAKKAQLVYSSSWRSVPYPVTAEAYVSKILDRQEFRKHCDAYQTRAAIVDNLK